MWLLIMFLIYQVSSSELPSISLLQKSSSSPVTCHATGFYPDQAMLFWAKDGDEVLEGVDPGEILPNNDETFQISVKLDLSSVRAEDWGRYSCVFQFFNAKRNITTKLDKTKIKSNQRSFIGNTTPFPIGAVIGGVIGFLVLVAIFAGILKWRQHVPLCCNENTPVQGSDFDTTIDDSKKWSKDHLDERHVTEGCIMNKH